MGSLSWYYCQSLRWLVFTWRRCSSWRSVCTGLEKVPISPWLVTLLHICGVIPTPQSPISPETPRRNLHASDDIAVPCADTGTLRADVSTPRSDVSATSTDVSVPSADIVTSNGKCSTVSQCFKSGSRCFTTFHDVSQCFTSVSWCFTMFKF